MIAIDLRLTLRPNRPGRSKKNEPTAVPSGDLPAPAAKPRRWPQRTIAAIALGVAALLVAIPTVLIAIYRFTAPPQTPLMCLRRAQGYELHHQWTRLSRISLAMRRAVIMSEDVGSATNPWGSTGLGWPGNSMSGREAGDPLAPALSLCRRRATFSCFPAEVPCVS